MKRIYSFRECYSKELHEFLEKNRIKYSEKKNEFIHLLIFSITDDAALAEAAGAYAEIGCTVDLKYTAAELSAAPLLRIRPKKEIVDVDNANEAFTCTCRWVDSNGIERARHRVQTASAVVKKAPPRKNAALLAPTVGNGCLFADGRIKQLAEGAGMKGIAFLNVLDKKGNAHEDLFQLSSANVIPRERVALGYGEKIEACPICQKTQILPPAGYELHLHMCAEDVSEDLYMTEDLFGEGIAEPYYLISQGFYRLLNSEGLLGDVEVLPVVLS